MWSTSIACSAVIGRVQMLQFTPSARHRVRSAIDSRVHRFVRIAGCAIGQPVVRSAAATR
jgi:hypothetical protein